MEVNTDNQSKIIIIEKFDSFSPVEMVGGFEPLTFH